MEDDILTKAIQFLEEGSESEAAEVLRTCVIEGWEAVDSWMDGSKELDGIAIEMKCPRSSYEILTDSKNPITRSIENAFRAVFPHDCYLKKIGIRAESVFMTASTRTKTQTVSVLEIKELIEWVDTQKSLMISVSTGGPRIQEVNRDYISRRRSIQSKLLELGITDPNPYSDLWSWYGKWSDGSLPTYQSRRVYVTDLYKLLVDALRLRVSKSTPVQPQEPTGWARVDRSVEKIYGALEKAENEEDFQTVGLLCRETIISLAQAVYKPEIHGSVNGTMPSDTDAKRMLESYLAGELPGESNENQRRFAKAVFQLAVDLQHRRSATFRDAALCAEATRAIVNTIATISGQRDPDSGE